MAIEAVVFDIGGVLCATPDLGVTAAWERRLGLRAGEIGARMTDVWQAGSLGAISEAAVQQAAGDRLGLGCKARADFMADIWREYLGTANAELISYAGQLRPRLRTGILSNSFVGAREREQAAYGFEDLVDAIIYSHESGVAKPDGRSYAIACERLRVAPGQTVFVDDHEACVAGARQAGLHAVRYQHNAQVIGAIEALLAS